MVDDGDSQDKREAATGVAIGLAARRGLLGGGQGGAGGLGAGLGRAVARRKSGGSDFLTAIVVICVLFGTLAMMIYMNAK